MIVSAQLVPSAASPAQQRMPSSCLSHPLGSPTSQQQQQKPPFTPQQSVIALLPRRRISKSFSLHLCAQLPTRPIPHLPPTKSATADEETMMTNEAMTAGEETMADEATTADRPPLPPSLLCSRSTSHHRRQLLMRRTALRRYKWRK